ncbi:MAG: aspartate carbamoyltransferase [Candidatus Nealsonbacteria bacterium]|nr:aspartate carbamoyltransferase [Candidatus Nealsonbacteria bacterium]
MTKLHHILKSQQFSKELLEGELFPLAKEMEKIVKAKKKKTMLTGKIMVTLFYEPSTRTRLSFEMAMQKLGGGVVSTENAKEFSSAAKGEKIEDTIRVICGYHPDVVVLRTSEEGMAEKAAELSPVPVINAGDGTGQHPTQTLPDLYTIQEKMGRISGTWMAVAGDLARGRTVHSLAYLYAKFPNVKISFVSPEMGRIPQNIKDYLKKHNVDFEELYNLKEVASKVDIIYSTRIQRERGGDILLHYKPSPDLEYSWEVNQEILNLMKKDAIVMHPLPHLEEIAPEVDKDPRAVYFRQAENGLYVRMALLKMILK